MANSNGKGVDVVNNILLIDPNVKSSSTIHNDASDSVHTSEKLSINVQLTTQRKSRSSIVIADSTNTIEKGKIGTLIDFMEGHKFSNNQESLSTHYTEIGTSFGDLLNNNVAPNLETLGIVDINIDFNAAFAPVIVINFIDVKGRLLQYGNNSPYSVFFDMPYPIFTLHVKGFYGKGIKYDLHLTKFNGKFNSQSGSFEIQCEFIGYTYAFLSDLLIGYLKGAPYTSNGKSLIAEKAMDTQFFTFKDLNETAQKTKVEIDKLKSDDEGSVPAIAQGESKLIDLEETKNTLNEYLSTLKTNDVSIKNESGVAIKVGFITPEEIKILSDSVDKLIASTNEKNKGAIEYNITPAKGKLIYNTNMINVTLKDGKSFSVSDLKNDDDTLFKTVNSLLNVTDGKVTDGTVADTSKLNGAKEFTVIDLTLLFKDIDRLITTIRQAIDDAKQNTAKTLAINLGQIKTSDGRNLGPTIGNYFQVLCNHVDLLMESIKMVAIKAESPDNAENRKNELQLAIQNKSNNEVDADFILAFPDYKIKNDKTGVLEEKWIGSIAPNLPEVLFINELIQGILTEAKNDRAIGAELADETIGNGGISWYPVSVMDTPFYIKNTENPYKILLNDGNDLDLTILMAFRAALFLTTNTSNNDDIVLMGQLEANNAFNNIPETVMKYLTVEAKTLGEKIDINLLKPTTSHPPFFSKEVGNHLEYGFHDYHVSLARVNNKKDLYKLFFNLPNNNNELFLNNYVSNNSGSQLESNSNYVKFIDSTVDYSVASYDGITLPSSKDTFDIDNIKESKISDTNLGIYVFKNTKNNGTSGIIPANCYFLDSKLKYTIFKEKIIGNCPFDIKNYKYRILKYQTLTGDEYPIINYTDIDSKDNISYRRNMLNNTFHILTNFSEKFYVGDLKFNNGNRNQVSLFGSTFYRNQNNYGKAYLFLASIPFDGVSENCDIFDGKFINMLNTKSGLVQMSYPWVLYIGAILKRAFDVDGEKLILFNKNYTDSSEDLHRVQLVYNYFGETPPNRKQLLFSDKKNYNRGVFNIESEIITDYPDVNPIILNLPNQVKREFIEQFETWVNGGFSVISSELDLFKNNSGSKITEFYQSIKSDPNNLFLSESKDILNNNFFKNYLNFGLNTFQNNSVYDFDLELSPDGYGSKLLTKFISSSILMVNNTCKVWQPRVDNNYSADTKILVNKGHFKVYKDAFVSEFNRLADKFKTEVKTVNTEVSQEVFQTLNGEDIRLKVYKDIKSIYDKWVCGSNYNYLKRLEGDENDKSLYQSFNFISRTYDDISDEFKINLPVITKVLTESYNQPIYAHISRVLGDNNFNFMPLPNYINYSKLSDVEAVFTPLPWNEMVEETKPKFVCMYVGEYSNKLDLGNKNGGDEASIGTVKDINGVTRIADKGIVGGDFASYSGDNKKIPVFLIKFGDQHQSIFKSINLNQSEFTNTNESLVITDGLTKGQGIGQNLFDVYQNRSYSVDIEMMGNVMVQPFMYFQLDNVPMFHGLYLIIKVAHRISNNSMITTLKGVRIKEVKTKMVDDSTLFNAFFSDLTDSINNGSLSGLTNSGTFPSSEYSEFITAQLPPVCSGLEVQGYNGKNEGFSNGRAVYRYGIKEVVDFLILLGSKWYQYARNTEYNDTIYYNDLSTKNGSDNKGHKSHKKGLSFDFRPICNKVKNKKGELVNFTGTISNSGSDNYSVEGNKAFIKLALDLAKSVGYGKTKTIKVFWYNDDTLINEFNNYYGSDDPRGLVKPMDGHSNHMHIEFYPPERVEKDIAENNIDTSVGTSGGLILNKGIGMSYPNSLQYLGKMNKT